MLIGIWASVALAACYASTSPGDASGDGATVDAGEAPDANGNPDARVDGGVCETYGTTQSAVRDAPFHAPARSICHEIPGVCAPAQDRCNVSLGVGRAYDCHEERLCLTTAPDDRAPESEWWGTCVDTEYCRWLNDDPASRPEQTCRYSEGTEYVNGPSDHECRKGPPSATPSAAGDVVTHARAIASPVVDASA